MHNINIDDAFSKYELTEGQKELVTRLNKFLSAKNESVFLLKGYAGTGKTFIIKGLTEYFSAIGRNYLLAGAHGKSFQSYCGKDQISSLYHSQKYIFC